MTDGQRERRRAWEAAAVAEAYERGRPRYPPEAVRWLTGEATRRVVELGAGTGKLTRGLIDAGHEVAAVEPAAEMRAILETAVRAATVLAGSAEEIPIDDATADVVVAGQAFHWFDHARALPEVARVLRPRGRLGLVWNMRDDDVPWVAQLSTILGAETIAHDSPVDALAVSGLFSEVEEASFRHEHAVDRDRLLDLVRSRSNVAVADVRTRESILAGVAAVYDAAAAGAAGLVVPYVAYCYRAVVR